MKFRRFVNSEIHVRQRIYNVMESWISNDGGNETVGKKTTSNPAEMRYIIIGAETKLNRNKSRSGRGGGVQADC